MLRRPELHCGTEASSASSTDSENESGAQIPSSPPLPVAFPNTARLGRPSHPPEKRHGSLGGRNARAAAAPALRRQRGTPEGALTPGGRPRWAAGDKSQLRLLTGPAEPPAPDARRQAGGSVGSGRSGWQRLSRLAAARPPPLPAVQRARRAQTAPAGIFARHGSPVPYLPSLYPSPAPRLVTWDSSRCPHGGADGAGRAGAERMEECGACALRAPGPRFRARAVFGCGGRSARRSGAAPSRPGGALTVLSRAVTGLSRVRAFPLLPAEAGPLPGRG